MNERDLYRMAYNAHERAEQAALSAMREELDRHTIEALACLADPEWSWDRRSFLSETICEYADAALNVKLDAAVSRF